MKDLFQNRIFKILRLCGYPCSRDVPLLALSHPKVTYSESGFYLAGSLVLLCLDKLDGRKTVLKSYSPSSFPEVTGPSLKSIFPLLTLKNDNKRDFERMKKDLQFMPPLEAEARLGSMPPPL